MKILYYDCFSGISGDMNLGAMLDLGVSRDELLSGLQKLNISGWRLEIIPDQRHGISGTRVTVITDELSVSPDDHDHGHDHEYDHGHGADHRHDHGHKHHQPQSHSHKNADHVHRNLGDIEKIVLGSGLPDNVTALAMKIFTCDC